MAREPTPTLSFSLVVVLRGDRALVVQERKHGQRWYLPAGRKEPCETFAEAALRETKEEAGVDVVLTGVLGIEHRPIAPAARLRVIFLAHPADGRAPKQMADAHSLGAAYLSLCDIEALPLRGDDVVYWVKKALEGGAVAPLSWLDERALP